MTLLPLTRPRPASVLVPLPDGDVAHLRPLQDGESAPLLEVFAGLSDQSRASRYLVGTPRLPPFMVRQLAATDGLMSVAWLATIADRPAGIGRYVRTDQDPCTADVALEVVDEHQRRGLGTILLDAITTVAVVHGVRRLHATALPDNRASLRLLSRVGLALSWEDGVLEGEAPLRLLDPAYVDRRAVVELARAGLPVAPRPARDAPCANAAH
jgi:RimJ/RimL family protein N-acetyltransferase